MIKDNIRFYLFGILIVSTLLLSCLSYDYADNNITIVKEVNTSNVKLSNNVSVIGVNESDSNLVVKSSDKVHTVVPKYPVISMWAKPSCGCRYSYTWHKYTFINYCPHCGKYGTLRKNPKGVYEQEYTCVIDDCDYCAVCGKEKYSWSRVYLRRA